jgi:hypothetical protein
LLKAKFRDQPECQTKRDGCSILFTGMFTYFLPAMLAKISSRGQKRAEKLRRQIRWCYFNAPKPLSIKAFVNPGTAFCGLASALLKAVCR